MKAPHLNTRLLLLALLLLLIVFGGLVWRARQAPPPPTPQPVPERPVESREVILYFGAPDATHLEAEQRELDRCGEEQQCLEAIVRALVDGPRAGLVPLLPPGTMLRRLTTDEDGLATLDFSRELMTGHPGGSMSELLTVYALADTLAANFPYIRQIRILIEGEPVETLKGHVDLRHPVSADFAYTRAPQDTELREGKR